MACATPSWCPALSQHKPTRVVIRRWLLVNRDDSRPQRMTDDASPITRLMTLYHVRWCPECAIVREKLGELGIPYDDVVVPDLRPLRQEVFAVSGQHYVPVIKD
ncbi:MAG: glutaredoxin family protein, partial [Nitrospiraceae bacterium]